MFKSMSRIHKVDQFSIKIFNQGSVSNSYIWILSKSAFASILDEYQSPIQITDSVITKTEESLNFIIVVAGLNSAS